MTQLASFLPTWLLRKLVPDAADLDGSRPLSLQAALLFIDIAGFTKVADRLAQHAGGADQLSAHLNGFFGPLVELVASHGGEIAKFAGDGFLAIWPADREPPDVVALRAAACTIEILHRSTYPLPAGQALRLHMAMAAGDVLVARVGGVRGRWEIVVGGPAMRELHEAQSVKLPNEIVLSSSMKRLLGYRITGEEISDGRFRLTGVRDAPAPRRLEITPEPAFWRKVLLAHVPGTLPELLGRTEATSLAEIRWITVLFFHFDDLDFRSPVSLDLLSKVVRTVQESIYAYGGAFDKVSYDEKGVSLVAAFGLPMRAFEPKSGHSVALALKVKDRLAELGVRCSIGMATGRVFCGPVGGPTRREYTLVGSPVNLAARLMQCAAGEILFDETTQATCRDRVVCEMLPPLSVPGWTLLVTPLRALGIRPPLAAFTTDPYRIGLVEREVEMSAFREVLKALKAGHGRIILLEGDLGIGKSRLIAEFLATSDQLGVRSLVGFSDPVERSIPFHSWRHILAGLFGIDDQDGPGTVRERVVRTLEKQRDVAPLAPLLRAVLPMDLPDHEATAGLSGPDRAEKTLDLLVALIQAQAQLSPLLLVMEDAHWADSSSWSLALNVARRVQPVVLVIARRTFQEAPPSEYLRILDEPSLLRLRLGALSRQGVACVTSELWHTRGVPDDLATWMLKRGGGNPLFTREIAQFLSDRLLVAVRDGEVVSYPPVERLGLLPVPESIESIVSTRITSLASSQQEILKVASIIGYSFSTDMLLGVMTDPELRTHLARDLDALVRAGFIVHVRPLPNPVYSFRHHLTLETAENMVPSDRKRALNLAAARWVEVQHAENLTPHHSLLAIHWDKAGDTERALHYLELSGQDALSAGAFPEAAAFFQRALTICPVSHNLPERVRLVRLERLLADAEFGMGLLEPSTANATRALEHAGYHLPKSSFCKAIHVVWQVLVQLAHLVWSSPFTVRPHVRALKIEASNAAQRLSERYHYSSEALPLALSAFLAVNLLEAAGPPIRQARQHASIGVVLGVLSSIFGFQRLSTRYFDRAVAYGDVGRDVSGAIVAWYLRGCNHLGLGRWDLARADAERARDLALANRVHIEIGMVQTLAALIEFYQGNYERTRQHFLDLLPVACMRANAQHEAWALYGLGMCDLKQGHLFDAESYLQKAMKLLGMLTDKPSQLQCLALLAAVQAKRGAWEEAEVSALRALDESRRIVPIVSSALEGLASTAEVLLAVWENNPSGGPSPERREQNARAASKLLTRFARLFPIGRARAMYVQGCLAWNSRQPERASTLWKTALGWAERLHMDMDRAVLHQVLATRGEADIVARSHHLAEARRLLVQVGSRTAADMELTG
jgi:class 3 adenylate cyclase/tetratricopeptide (TPR) repeat protein